MKSYSSTIAFYILIPVLLTVIFLSGYFILANTVLTAVIKPKVVVADQEVSLSNIDSDTLVEYVYQNLIPHTIQVSYQDQIYTIPVFREDFNVVNIDDITSFGRGSDVLKVMADSVTWAAGERIQLQYQLSPKIITEYIPHKFGRVNGAHIDANNTLTGCEQGTYDVLIDYQRISDLLSSSDLGQVIEISDSDLVLQDSELLLQDQCSKYLDQLTTIGKAFYKYDLPIPDTLEYVVGYGWKIQDGAELFRIANMIKQKSDSQPAEGEYVNLRGRIVMISPYKLGVVVDLDKTVVAITEWLTNPTSVLPVAKVETYPEVLTKGREIIDATHLVGEGKTRIDLNRNGSYNWVVPFAEHGVREMNNKLIMPGEQFSYIKTINPQPNGLMESGRPIGSGICNATTTLFRAVLESGFPITDRSSHGTSYSSYAWGYPLNIVDAAYLTTPQVDFKFVNDFEYPILLQSVVTQDNFGWQYHTIQIYSDPKAPTREVELTGFKITSRTSASSYSGQFIRNVYQDGVFLRRDIFKSRYR